MFPENFPTLPVFFLLSVKEKILQECLQAKEAPKEPTADSIM